MSAAIGSTQAAISTAQTSVYESALAARGQHILSSFKSRLKSISQSARDAQVRRHAIAILSAHTAKRHVPYSTAFQTGPSVLTPERGQHERRRASPRVSIT